MIEPSWKNEKAFQASVIKAAKQFGWKVYHTTISYGSAGGFPDLVLIHPPDIIYAELKMPKGRLTEKQKEYGDLLLACNAEYHVWKPEMWDRIITRLIKQ